MKRVIGAVAAAGVVMSLSGGTASAQALAALLEMHSKRIEGGRLCLTDHFHYGNSSGQSTRAAAEREAIASWSSFTAWEYGNEWGSWRLAGSKAASCSSSGGSWSCQVEARPCSPASRRR